MRFFLVPLLFLSLHATAQSLVADSCSHSFTGRVFDASNQQPLPFVSVQLKGTTVGTVSDKKGRFTINNICREEYDVIFAYVGYKQLKHHHDAYHPESQIYLAPDNMMLESIIIEGKQQPGNLSSGTVNELNSQTLQQNQSASLGDVAANLSGVNMLKTGQNIVKPIIHGLHSNRVLIINNGVRHEFQNWGTEHAPEVDPSLADNISVVKGAATVRYGPEALGGVLLINPPTADYLTPLKGKATVNGESNGRGGEGTFQLRKGFHKIAVTTQGSYGRYGDRQAPDYLLTNTGKEEYSVAAGIRAHAGKTDWTADYSRFYQNIGLLRGSINGNLQDLTNALQSEVPEPTRPFTYRVSNPRQEVTHDLFKASGKLTLDSQTVRLQYAFQQNRRKEFDVRRGTLNERPAINLQLMSHTLDVDWDHRNLGRWSGRIGFQGLIRINDNIPGTNTLPFIPNYNLQQAGLYLIESTNINDIKLEVGMRYDIQQLSVVGRAIDNSIFRNQLNYQSLTATAGIVKVWGENVSFRSNVGSAWRPPNVAELYSFGRRENVIEDGLWRVSQTNENASSGNGILNQADRAIPAEMGWKWINTYSYYKDQLQIEATAYANYIANYIYTRPIGVRQTVRGAFPAFTYDQDDALYAGADLDVSILHTSRFSSQASASWVYARNLSRKSNLLSIPPANLRYTAEYTIPSFKAWNNITFSLGGQYTARSWQPVPVIPPQAFNDPVDTGGDIFDFAPVPGDYLLVKAGIQAEINSFYFSLQGMNLLNNRYRNYTDSFRYYADDMGINSRLTVEYVF